VRVRARVCPGVCVCACPGVCVRRQGCTGVGACVPLLKDPTDFSA